MKKFIFFLLDDLAKRNFVNQYLSYILIFPLLPPTLLKFLISSHQIIVFSK